MRFCLLTTHPTIHSVSRLCEETQHFKLSLEVQNPLTMSVSWPAQSDEKPYELTLNRVSSIENDNFLQTLFSLPRWGRQVNNWEIRRELWDKTRQGLWMTKRGWPHLPFFCFRGQPLRQSKSWEDFSQRHETGQGWVLKMNRGQQGVGVHFFQHRTELERWLETLWRIGDQDFLIQPRWAVESEYRVTLLGGVPWAILQRRGAESLANYAQGGEASEVSYQSLPQNLRAFIDAICAETVMDYLSLDILLSLQGMAVVDVNTTPGFQQLESVTQRNFANDLLKHLLTR